LNIGDGVNGNFVVLDFPTFFFGCKTAMATELFNMTSKISINIAYFTEANHFMRLLIR
jgi:hypothetical protein